MECKKVKVVGHELRLYNAVTHLKLVEESSLTKLEGMNCIPLFNKHLRGRDKEKCIYVWRKGGLQLG